MTAYIAIDFDGTIVENRYPSLGSPVPGAFEWMKKFQEAGAKLILYTMRDGKTLDDAVKLCKENGIEFWGVNKNHDQDEWTSSPKVWAHVYIDDHGFNCPLIIFSNKRSYVDWDIVGPEVMKIINAMRGIYG